MTAVSVISPAFIRSYWITMRPYLLFVSGVTGLAGLSFAPQLPAGETTALFLAFFLSYGFGQALTDCFQTDTDSLSSPYRPLVRGVISKTQVLAVSLLGLGACGAVLAWFALSNVLLALLCTIGLATYTFFKRRWWGGPWYNGWIVVLLFVIGFNSGLGNSRFDESDRFLFALVCVLFGYGNFVLVGYFKDVSADSSTGYETLPVKFGRPAAAAASDLAAIVFCITGAASVFLTVDSEMGAPSTLGPTVFAAASIITSIRTQRALHRVTADKEAWLAVSPSLQTYILMLCAVAAANKPDWTVPLAIFYAAFMATLIVRPERSQI